jgi:iron(III) transport system substrate-binding protein
MYCNRHLIPLAAAVLSVLAGCWRDSADEIIVYTAHDSEFSRPVFDTFTKKTSLKVASKFDTESTKTVGLTEAILAERKRPRCDVFWNNEILNTLRLEREGLLEPYQSPAAADLPDWAKASDGAWHGFAARARILIVNTKLVPEDERPTSIHDLAAEKWRGRCGIAKPLFGTTATHAACLFAALGDEKAKELFAAIKANHVQILSGNKQVAVAVATGQLAFGLTDTDDGIGQIREGRPVMIVYPDQGDEELGTLFIPNTVAIIRGAPHAEAAKKLIDFLLSAEVEKMLAEGAAEQIPLNPKVTAKTQIKTPRDVKAMEVDWEKAADQWTAAARFIRDEFTAP